MIWNGRVALFAVVTGVALVAACDHPRLEPEERFGLEVKPAIVRVNSYASARFAYPAEQIRVIEKIVVKAVPGAFVRRLSGAETEEIEAGTGVSGSGFIINPSGYILTARSVATAVDRSDVTEEAIRRNGAVGALIRHFSADPLRQLARDKALEPLVTKLARAGSVVDLTLVNDVELANGERYRWELRRMPDAAADRNIAIVRIQRRNLPSLRIGDSAPVRIDDPLWVVGYPAVVGVRDEVLGGWVLRDADLESTLNPGVVTKIETDAKGLARFVTNAAIYVGNAGGPAISRGDGSVIGIAFPPSGPDDAKALVPIDDIKSIVEDSGVSFDDGGDFQTSYRRALDAMQRGRVGDASRDLAFASQLFPNYPDLIRLMAEAQQEEAANRPSKLIVVLLGFAIVLLAVVVVQFSLRVRGANRLEPPPIPRITHDSYVRPASRAGSEPVPDTKDTLLGRLTVLSGDRAGERIGLGGSGIRVGREQSMCEIVLENPKVSRLHAEFVEMEGRVLLIDRNSSNGTYVNDRKIDKRFLEDGDIIYFGGRNAIAVAFST